MAVVPLRRQQPEVVIDDAPAPTFDQSTAANGDIVITIGDGSEPERKPRTSKGFSENLADGMGDHAMGALASFLLDGIDADLQSRKEWEETANEAAKYLGIKLQDPSISVSPDGTVCKEVATCLLESLVKLWGTARAELLPVGGPVKVRRDDVPALQEAPEMMGHNGGPPLDKSAGIGGPMPEGTPQGNGIVAGPPTAQKDAKLDDLADALEKDLNHYLTVGDREYYPDFSKMLLHRALIGNAFRKVYRDPLKRKPVSTWVKAQDLIISNDCSHLSGAGRVTERIRYRQSTMKRLQKSGHYLDIPLVMPTGAPTDTEQAVSETEGIIATPMLPSDFEHQVYECYCEIGSGTSASLIGDLSDLEKDETGHVPGYPLPYRVSIDVDSRQILEIRRNWKQGDPDYNPRRWYVKYGFIPGFGYYDFGLIHLCGNPTQVATMIQRSCVDSALLNNFPAFIQMKGPASRQENTVLRPGPGEVVTIENGGSQRVQDVMMPMPYKPPSAEAMQLGMKAEGDVRRLAGIIELPVGEGRIGNTPVGTIMSYIESVSMVPGAVHKDDHISQADEFEMLRELIAEEPQVLWRGNRSPARKWQVAEELLQPDLVPAADPNTPSQIHRLMKTQGLIMLGAQPQYAGIADNRAIYRHAVRVLAGEDAAEFEMPQQPAQAPPPDPKIVAAQIKAQADLTKVQASTQKDAAAHQERMTQIQAEGDQRAADRESAEVRSAMSLEAAKVKAAADAQKGHADRLHDAFQGAADRSHEHAQTATQAALSAPLMGDETTGTGGKS